MAERVAVLGVGLIGGSLALCLKERTEAYVVGYDRSRKNIDLAQSLGVIDEGHLDFEQAIQGADFIFLALPVQSILEAIDQLCQFSLKPGCIVSDVGSTKAVIVERGKKLQTKGISFIGGHPMAGSHRSGVEAANSLLFENAYYILTPLPDTSLLDVQKLSCLLYQATRAKLVIMEAEKHDQVVGAISHLPHIIAVGLVSQVGNYNEKNEWFHRLAAGGFRDLTRIAASHPEMWRDILISNRKQLVPLMDDWIEEMVHFRESIAQEDAKWIEEKFARSRLLRRQLPDRRKGLLEPLYECYVDVPDQPGSIGKVATLLGDKNISLSNIGVMENREEHAGVLRLSFRDDETLQKAIECLRQAGYTVFARDE